MAEIRRKPRFKKTKEIRNFQLTERDIEIIRHVFKHRFLKSTHILKVVKGSRQGTLRRLQLLYHAGYLDRPSAQIDYFHRGGGCQPMVYGIANGGADLLQEKFSIPKRKVDWTAKNRIVTRIFLQHTLAVADFMVALETSCRKHDFTFERIELTDRWNASVNHKDETAKIGIIPDAVFKMTMPAKEPVHFCLEVDRGTMPTIRRSLDKTSVHRKFLAYHASWRQGIASDLFGWKRFRVLILTSTAQRADNLRRTAGKLDSGHGLFLFAHRAQMEKAADLFSLQWQGLKADQTVSLLDS